MKITMAATTTSQTSPLRPLLVRIVLAALVIFLCSILSRAGGPKRIAGTSYFDASTHWAACRVAVGRTYLLHRSGRPQSDSARIFRRHLRRRRLESVDILLHPSPQRAEASHLPAGRT